MKSILLCLLFVACACEASAHRDRPITLDGSRLVGLPKVYSPASFDIGAGILAIGGRSARLPAFTRPLLAQSEDPVLTFSASWYHDRKVTPLYLKLSIAPRDRDYSLDLLFDLETADLFRAYVCVQLADGIVQELPIDIDEMKRFEVAEELTDRSAQPGATDNPGDAQ